MRVLDPRSNYTSVLASLQAEPQPAQGKRIGLARQQPKLRLFFGR
jgi:hypothetical protein